MPEADNQHQPVRPAWDCLVCKGTWPCDPARERLIAVFHPVVLSILQVQRLYDAAHDMPTASPAELFERFIAWTCLSPDRP